MTLEISNLEICFGNRRAVAIEHFHCGAGEIVGLVGESGCGKSITARAVLGLATRLGASVTGSIRLDGQELVGASEREFLRVRGRRVSMIFQEPTSAFSPVMRVGELFVRTLRLHGESSRRRAHVRAREAVEALRLPDAVLARYPHQLSGGQLQRVAIAIAIALDTELLLADEPTTALDVTVQAETLELLEELRSKRGLAIVLISHDVAVVSQIADRVAVMQGGSIVEMGPVSEVLARPAHSYTRELLAAVPRLHAGAA